MFGRLKEMLIRTSNEVIKDQDTMTVTSVRLQNGISGMFNILRQCHGPSIMAIKLRSCRHECALHLSDIRRTSSRPSRLSVPIAEMMDVSFAQETALVEQPSKLSIALVRPR